MFAPRFDAQDPGMFMRCKIADFLEESLTEGSVRHQLAMRDLDDYLALELLVEGRVDGRHAAAIE